MTRQSIPGLILVVDDDAMSREVLSMLLEAEGYTVEALDSGGAAIELLRNCTLLPQVVLTDVQMPGISGRRLAVRLRFVCGPETILLAMSGSGPAADEIEAYDGFLLKPFTMDEVTAAISAKAVPTAASAPELSVTSQAGRSAAESRAAEIAGVPSILNEGIYTQLASSMPTEQLHQLYALCLDDARKRIGRMRDSAAAKDNGQFVREAHAIKGGCGMLGATELYGISAGLEASGLKARGLTASAAAGKNSVNPLDELSAACERLERMLMTRGVASTP